MPVRIGLIGCGFFGRFHLQAWRDLAAEGAALVAIADVDEGRAREAAALAGVERWSTDPEQLLAAGDIDLLDIATRMDTHRPLVEAATARGIATVVQKPMAPSLADCVAMVEAARRAGVFFAVHENFRFQSPMRAAKAIIDAGEIGEPSWARFSFRTGVDVYRNQPYFYDEERLVILDLGIHMLDLARFFLGEVAHLACETQRRNRKVKAEDTAAIMLRHASGAVSLAECTYENRRSDRIETIVEIEAERGGITIGTGGQMTIVTPSGMRRRRMAKPKLAWAAPPLHLVQESVLATCRHMLAAVAAGRDAETSGHDNLKTFRLVEAAYEAAARGSVVQIAG